MVATHSLLWANAAEQVTLLLIGSSHDSLHAPRAASLHYFQFFSSPLDIIRLFTLFANQQNPKRTSLYSRPFRSRWSDCLEVSDRKEDILRAEIKGHRARVLFGRYVFNEAVTIR